MSDIALNMVVRCGSRPSDTQVPGKEWGREWRSEWSQRSGGSGELSSQERARGGVPPSLDISLVFCWGYRGLQLQIFTIIRLSLKYVLLHGLRANPEPLECREAERNPAAHILSVRYGSVAISILRRTGK